MSVGVKMEMVIMIMLLFLSWPNTNKHLNSQNIHLRTSPGPGEDDEILLLMIRYLHTAAEWADTSRQDLGYKQDIWLCLQSPLWERKEARCAELQRIKGRSNYDQSLIR